MHSHRPLKVLALGFVYGLLILGLTVGRLEAQVVRGSISGAVVDPSGAAVPEAEVRATNTETAQLFTTNTEATGLFHLALLPAGSYTLEVSKSGFRKFVLRNVEVSANLDNGLGSLTLQVGPIATSVEVSAAPPLLETTQAQVSTSIKGEVIATFAGVGEGQGLDFLALQLPGVVNNRDLGFSNTNGPGFAVNGLRGRNNDQQIDGQNNNDNSVAGPYLFVGNPDVVEEYQITTNNFGPEYGRNSGSVINIVTKSGTNNWHGTVFGNEGNSALNSLSNVQKTFESLKKVPRFNEEFTGVTIGGPLKKDRAFLFAGFDDVIISQRSVYSTGNLTPTPTGLSQLATCYPGSDSVAAIEMFGPYGVKGGNPTVSGTPETRTLTGANTADGTCNVEFAGVQRTLPTPTHTYDFISRLDVNGAHDRVYGRFIYQKITIFNTDAFGTVGAGPAAGYPVNVPSFGEDIGVSWVHNFSGRMVNEARLSFGRLTVEFGGNTIGNTVPEESKIDSALAKVRMPSGFLSFGPETNAPQGRIVNTYQAQDNWSYFRGRHQIKAGFNYTYQRSPNIFLPNFNGSFRYRNFTRYALNRPRSVTIALGSPSLDFREHDFFTYIGDDVKVKSNLTLNLGMTYSYFGQPANLFHRNDTKRESNASTAFFDPSLPLSIRTFSVLPSAKTSFGPSVGFAYTRGKTVLRGGYRLAYDPAYYNIYLNISTSAPQVLLQTLTGATAASIPLPAQPFGPAVRSELAPDLTLGVFDPRNFNRTDVTPTFSPDFVQSWSFGIQRELTPHAVLEARYVGNHGSDLFQSVNQNPDISAIAADYPSVLPSGLTPCSDTDAVVPQAVGRVSCDSGPLRRRTNSARSDYEALQVELRGRNIGNQLNLRTAYTWSKTTDNASEIFGSFAGGGTYAFSQNPLDFIHGEHSLSGLDIPQNWTLGFQEEIPAFRSQQGVRGKVLGGWGISGTYSIASGQTYSPVQFFLNGVYPDLGFLGAFNAGAEALRPFLSSPSAPANQVGIFAADACGDFGVGCGLAANALLSLNAINATGAETPVSNSAVRFIVNAPQANSTFGTPWGTAGRNTLRDYHTNFAQFELFKTIKITERVNLRWNMTMLNAFNHPNFSSIDPFVDDAGLATETTGFADPRLFTGSNLVNFSQGSTPSAGQRAIKFGLKVIF